MAGRVTDQMAAGWKRDPTGRFAGRYWNGSAWTEHVVANDRVRSLDPLQTVARPAETAPEAPQPPPGPAPLAADDATRPALGEFPPPAAASPPTRRRSRIGAVPGWAKIAALVAVLVVVALMMRRGGDNDDTPTVTVPKKTYAVGDTVRTADFDVTIHKFTDPQPPGAFLKPEPGTHFVSIDVQVVNRSSKAQAFSSLLGFQVFDGRGTEFSPTFTDLLPGPPDGELAPGESARGMAVFQVADGATGLRVRARGVLTAEGVDILPS